MLKVPACLVAVALVAPPPASDPFRVAGVARAVAAHETTEEERAAAEKELMGYDPVEVLPAVAAEIDGAGAAAPGYGAEQDSRARAQAALRRLWDHHVHGKIEFVRVSVAEPDGTKWTSIGVRRFRPVWQQAAVGKALTSIHAGARSEHARWLAIQGLQQNYSPDAEAPLAAILREETSPCTMTAARILLEQHTAAYWPLLIERAADARRGVTWRRAYLNVLFDAPLGGLGAAERKRLVRVGFALLAEDRDYFTAGRLERFTGQRFKPDPRAARYQGAHSLTDDFFNDTVANALSWWADNRERYE